MSKQVSCGILIVNARKELLLAHVTGQDWWDIPKGLRHKEEPSRTAALREAYEEAGVQLSDDALTDLGQLPYLKKKDLHLFAAPWPYASTALDFCHCSTHFECKRTGRLRPEMDNFKWACAQDIPAHCGKYLTAVLFEQLNFEDIATALACHARS